jgi:hypothetical protein
VPQKGAYEPFCRARKTASLSDLTNQQLNMYSSRPVRRE